MILDIVFASDCYQAFYQNLIKTPESDRVNYLNGIKKDELEKAFAFKKDIWEAIEQEETYKEILPSILEISKGLMANGKEGRLIVDLGVVESLMPSETGRDPQPANNISASFDFLLGHRSPSYYNKAVFKTKFLDILEYWGLALLLDISDATDAAFQTAMQNGLFNSSKVMMKCFGDQLDPGANKLLENHFFQSQFKSNIGNLIGSIRKK